MKKILGPGFKEGQTIEEKVQIVNELKGRIKLDVLLKYLKLSKSTYYDVLKYGEERKHKDDDLAKLIKSIFDSHYKKYGYPRITIELNNRGIHINEKKVARIMKEHHISAEPKKKKYCSYRGEVGSKAPNVIKRHFDVGEPYRVFGTDVTQFRIGEDKLYLSPIIDFHTREIVSYDISIHPNMLQIKRMMHQLEDKYKAYLPGSIIHSDQGWQYQQKWYQDFLEEHQMIQSMSRKGNCLDNSPTENFFGRLKEEVFYGQEWRYENINQLREAIHKWIKYYNEERIIVALKNSPMKYKCELLQRNV
ncbi:MAG: IS3 family transposase [Erysipelotrichaceae bacterium]|nr:IS3 family transposase [Erysipelotrichaceae bacterium]